jgi:hypothetical protein
LEGRPPRRDRGRDVKHVPRRACVRADGGHRLEQATGSERGWLLAAQQGGGAVTVAGLSAACGASSMMRAAAGCAGTGAVDPAPQRVTLLRGLTRDGGAARWRPPGGPSGATPARCQKWVVDPRRACVVLQHIDRSIDRSCDLLLRSRVVSRPSSAPRQTCITGRGRALCSSTVNALDTPTRATAHRHGHGGPLLAFANACNTLTAVQRHQGY